MTSGYDSLTSEMGKIYFKADDVRFNDTLVFRLFTFLWSHDISVIGVKAA